MKKYKVGDRVKTMLNEVGTVTAIDSVMKLYRVEFRKGAWFNFIEDELRHENSDETLDTIRNLSDESLDEQITVHRSQLDFGEEARRALHQRMLDLCIVEKVRRGP